MSDILTVEKLRLLPISDRLRLLEEVWESLADEPDTIGVPDWHKKELDSRIEAQRDLSGELRQWNAVEARVLQNLKK